MKKNILIIVLTIASSATIAQDWPLKNKVMEKKANQVSFIPLNAFTFTKDQAIGGRGVYQELKADNSALQSIINERPEALQFSLPISNQETIICELIKTDFGNVKYTQNRTQPVTDAVPPVCYRGIVTGEKQKNNVLLTINQGYFSFTATFNDKIIQLGQTDENDKSTYRLYNSNKLEF